MERENITSGRSLTERLREAIADIYAPSKKISVDVTELHAAVHGTDDASYVPCEYTTSGHMYLLPDDHVNFQPYVCLIRMIDADDRYFTKDMGDDEIEYAPAFMPFGHDENQLVTATITIAKMIDILSQYERSREGGCGNPTLKVCNVHDIPAIYAFLRAYRLQLSSKTDEKCKAYYEKSQVAEETFARMYQAYSRQYGTDISPLDSLLKMLMGG